MSSHMNRAMNQWHNYVEQHLEAYTRLAAACRWMRDARGPAFRAWAHQAQTFSPLQSALRRLYMRSQSLAFNTWAMHAGWNAHLASVMARIATPVAKAFDAWVQTSDAEGARLQALLGKALKRFKAPIVDAIIKWAKLATTRRQERRLRAKVCERKQNASFGGWVFRARMLMSAKRQLRAATDLLRPERRTKQRAWHRLLAQQAWGRLALRNASSLGARRTRCVWSHWLLYRHACNLMCTAKSQSSVRRRIHAISRWSTLAVSRRKLCFRLNRVFSMRALVAMEYWLSFAAVMHSRATAAQVVVQHRFDRVVREAFTYWFHLAQSRLASKRLLRTACLSEEQANPSGDQAAQTVRLLEWGLARLSTPKKAVDMPRRSFSRERWNVTNRLDQLEASPMPRDIVDRWRRIDKREQSIDAVCATETPQPMMSASFMASPSLDGASPADLDRMAPIRADHFRRLWALSHGWFKWCGLLSHAMGLQSDSVVAALRAATAWAERTRQCWRRWSRVIIVSSALRRDVISYLKEIAFTRWISMSYRMTKESASALILRNRADAKRLRAALREWRVVARAFIVTSAYLGITPLPKSYAVDSALCSPEPLIAEPEAYFSRDSSHSGMRWR
jgi:hypothetical protein